MYPWYVILAYLDVAMTWTILSLGGTELNPIAATIIEHGQLQGMVCFKCLTMVIVLASCEYIGRVKHSAGFRLAAFAVIANIVPVTVGASQIALFAGFTLLYP